MAPPTTEDGAFSWGLAVKKPKSASISVGSRFYESFTWENEKYRVGDYVLIANGEDETQPFVGTLKSLSIQGNEGRPFPDLVENRKLLSSEAGGIVRYHRFTERNELPRQGDLVRKTR